MTRDWLIRDAGGDRGRPKGPQGIDRDVLIEKARALIERWIEPGPQHIADFALPLLAAERERAIEECARIVNLEQDLASGGTYNEACCVIRDAIRALRAPKQEQPGMSAATPAPRYSGQQPASEGDHGETRGSASPAASAPPDAELRKRAEELLWKHMPKQWELDQVIDAMLAFGAEREAEAEPEMWNLWAEAARLLGCAKEWTDSPNPYLRHDHRLCVFDAIREMQANYEVLRKASIESDTAIKQARRELADARARGAEEVWKRAAEILRAEAAASLKHGGAWKKGESEVISNVLGSIAGRFEDFAEWPELDPARCAPARRPQEEKTMSKCELCGHPMPPGEEMFKYHGHSGACPAPPASAETPDRTTPSVGGRHSVAQPRQDVGADWADEIAREWYGCDTKLSPEPLAAPPAPEAALVEALDCIAHSRERLIDDKPLREIAAAALRKWKEAGR